MRMLRLVPASILFLLLAAQVTFLPGQANAFNCCPCFNPCKVGCVCRGTASHCPVCRAGGSDLQPQAGAIIPVPGFSPSYEDPFFILPTTAFSGEFTELVRGSNRAMGDPTLRLLANAEFRLIFWCPQSEEHSVPGAVAQMRLADYGEVNLS